MSSNCLAPEILPACIQVGQYTGDKFLQVQSGQQNLRNMAIEVEGEITEQLGWAFGFFSFFGSVFSVFLYFGFWRIRTEVVPKN